MGCDKTLHEINTDPRFVFFHSQIQHKHKQLENENFPLFKIMCRTNSIAKANKEISAIIDQKYRLYMEQVLEDREADEAFEILVYFQSYGSNHNLLSRQQMQDIMSEDFSEEIDRMFDNM